MLSAILVLSTLQLSAEHLQTRGDHLGFGHALAAAGDVNADGISDLWIGDPGWNSPRELHGRAWLVSGADGRTLTACTVPRSGLGIQIVTGGDADGDGVGDLIATNHSSLLEIGIHVEARSSCDGAVLWTQEVPSAVGLPHPCIGILPDLDGDGCPEIASSSSQTNVGGPLGQLAWVLSGRDGRVVRALRSDSTAELTAAQISFAGDLDLDGEPEVAVLARPVAESAGSKRYLVLLPLRGSGAERRIEFARERGVETLARVDDGDGCESLAVGALGCVRLLTAGTLTERWSVSGERSEWFGTPLAVLDDIDRDGAADLAIGAENAGLYGGAVRVVSGRHGAELYRFDDLSLGVDEDVHHVGRALVTVGDLDGDGKADFAAGCDNSRGGTNGRAFVLSGATGELRFEFTRNGNACVVLRSWRDAVK